MNKLIDFITVFCIWTFQVRPAFGLGPRDMTAVLVSLLVEVIIDKAKKKGSLPMYTSILKSASTPKKL